MSDIGIRLGVEGEREFKNALRDINQSFKVLGSEMKLVSSEFDRQDKSVAAVSARNEVLGKTIDAQKEKVTTLEAALRNASDSFGENDKRTQNWAVQLNNAKAELNDMERELENNNRALDKAAEGMSGAEREAAGLGEAAGGAGKELNAAGKSAQNAADETEKAGGKFAKIGSVIKDTAEKIAGAVAAVGAAAVAVGTGMFKLAESAAATGREINNTSQKLGLSREGFQEWDYILKKSGTSIDVMGTGMKTLQKTMGGLTEDGDSASKAFAAIGISFDEIKGKTPEEALNMTVKALQDMPAGADRTAAALKLFGKGAMELQPLLNKTSEETDALRQRAHDLGLVMSDEQVDAAGKFNGAMGRVRDTIAGFKLQISSALLPAFADGVSAFLDFAQGAEGGEEKMKSAVDNIVSAITDTIPKMIEKGAEMISGLVTGISHALPGVVGAISAVLPAIIGVVTDLVPKLVNSVMGAMPLIVNAILSALPLLAGAAVQIILALANGISDMLPELIPVAIDAVMSIVQGLLGNLSPLLDAALQLVLGLADGILAALPSLIAALPAIIVSLVDFLIGAIPQIIDAGIKLLVSLVQALPQIISAIVEAIPQIIDGLITAILGSIPELIQAGMDLLISLVENLPEIITTIVAAIPQIVKSITGVITGNIDKIIMAGVQLFVSLIENLPTIILEILKAVPQIITGIVEAFGSFFSTMAETGGNLIKGLWQGISDAGAWLWNKISGFFGGIVDRIKDFFGIHSPSVLFAGLGGFMAEGLGVGFESEMKTVSRRISDSIPSDFEMNGSVNATAKMGEDMVNALAAVMGGNTGGTYNITITVDKDTLARVMFDPLRGVLRQTGEVFA